MRRSQFRSLAGVSLLLAATLAAAATRPRYGGVLRIETRASVGSLEPVRDDAFSPDASVRDHMAMLIFDGLTRLDRDGHNQPALATSWGHDPSFRRWEFRLRAGVYLHDGSLLSTRIAVASISAANAQWRVRIFADDVVIESDAPMPNLLTELALPRYAITARSSDGTPVGTGPFRIAEWQPGRRMVLAENENYWAGRPFLDRIEILCGRSLRDQALDLRLNRTDVIEVPPDQSHPSASEARVLSSSPVVLIALLFSEHRAVEDVRLRQALSAAIDRSTIQTAILQKQGEPAADLLPQWISGYSFLLPVAADLESAKQLRTEVGSTPTLSLAYDWSDALAHAISDRIAVNARDIGITIQPFGENLAARAPNADLRMVRLEVPSSNPAVALASIAQAVHGDLQMITNATAPEEIFKADRALRQQYKLVPIVYIPESYSVSAGVKNWPDRALGGWPLEEVWVQGQQP